MGQVEGKLWGATETLLALPFVSLHRASIQPGFRCSRHFHRYKWNGFLLIAGGLDIRVYQPSGVEDVTALGPGDWTAVAPGVSHRFESREASLLLEVYWPEGLSEDIVRADVGGLL